MEPTADCHEIRRPPGGGAGPGAHAPRLGLAEFVGWVVSTSVRFRRLLVRERSRTARLSQRTGMNNVATKVTVGYATAARVSSVDALVRSLWANGAPPIGP